MDGKEKALQEVTQEANGLVIEDIKKKYGIVYEVSADITPQNDYETKEIKFLFKRPTAASYDRYIKSISKNASMALEMFCRDNVIDEQKGELGEIIKEYPMLTISMGQKLMAILGSSDNVNFKML